MRKVMALLLALLMSVLLLADVEEVRRKREQFRQWLRLRNKKIQIWSEEKLR